VTVEDFITKHEGRKNKPYVCPAGLWTIGVGHQITGKEPVDIDSYLKEHGEITEEMINRLLAVDIQQARHDCEKLFPDFEDFTVNRQIALIDWMFNILGRQERLSS